MTIVVLLATAQCAPAIKRDYSNIPAGHIGFEDMCGLQTYFDRLEMKIDSAPEVISAVEIQGKGTRSGRARFTFKSDLQLRTVRQVLTDNWKRLPEGTTTATRIEIEVRWSERSGLRRVVTNEDALLMVGRDETPLPYHVCLSELLFGEPLYHQRREALGLGPLPTPPPIVRIPAATEADAGMPGLGGVARVDGSADGAPTRPLSPVDAVAPRP